MENEIEADAGLTVDAQKAKLKEAMDDYKKLDYEDVVSTCTASSKYLDTDYNDRNQIEDLPTRFKYTKSAPQTYGLTNAEILLATDAELNEFLAVKHYAPYRHGSGVGAAGRGMRDRLKILKTRLAARRWGEEAEDETKNPKGSDRQKDKGWAGKNKVVKEKGTGEGPKKRVGKKERKRQAAATAENDGEASMAAGSKRKAADDIAGDGSSKKQRM